MRCLCSSSRALSSMRDTSGPVDKKLKFSVWWCSYVNCGSFTAWYGKRVDLFGFVVKFEYLVVWMRAIVSCRIIPFSFYEDLTDSRRRESFVYDHLNTYTSFNWLFRITSRRRRERRDIFGFISGRKEKTSTGCFQIRNSLKKNDLFEKFIDCWDFPGCNSSRLG